MMNILLACMEWAYTMTEIKKIILFWIKDSGQVYWLVVMDTQDKIRMVIIVLVIKIPSGEQLLLKYTELSDEESNAKIN